MQIATVGHTTHDIYDHGYEAGGSAFYSAHAYAYLGHSVVLYTGVGADFELAGALDVEHEIWDVGHTTTFFNTERPGDTRLQLVQSIGRPMPPASLSERYIHLAPVMGELDLEAWVDANPDASVAMSLQGWVRKAEPWAGVRQPGWPDAVVDDARLVLPARFVPGTALSRVSIVCMSEEDVAHDAGLYRLLRDTVPHGALTRGERGALVWSGEHEWNVDAVPAQVVDTTGAGDTFAAAFCAAIWAGESAPRAAEQAVNAAAVVIGAKGASALSRL